MSTFAERLKDSIDMRGVTQRWLAEKANTTEATISRYVKEVNNPAVLEIIANIAKALDVSVDYLVGVTNLPESKGSVSPEEKILLSCFNRASDDDRRVLWALLDKYLAASEKDYLSQFNRTHGKNVG